MATVLKCIFGLFIRTVGDMTMPARKPELMEFVRQRNGSFTKIP